MEKPTKITLPKFKVGRYVLNEYELRLMMLEVAKGEREGNIKVKDLSNNIESIIQEGGHLSNTLPGLSINSKITMEFIKIKRNVQDKEEKPD